MTHGVASIDRVRPAQPDPHHARRKMLDHTPTKRFYKATKLHKDRDQGTALLPHPTFSL